MAVICLGKSDDDKKSYEHQKQPGMYIKKTKQKNKFTLKI